MNATLERLSEHLFRFEDTCNVYVLVDPADTTRCLLVDFGSGAILDRLGEIGVSRVEWILHTHHHRDQAQGDHLAVARGIPLAVPEHERHLFDDVENFWKNRRILHLYYVRNTYFTLTQSVPVARELRHLPLGGLRPGSAAQPRPLARLDHLARHGG
jgi:glyoxylase-like metal-dependent hydrolase (beta-lactamase superfamily II)